jgi:hypothetical protein
MHTHAYYRRTFFIESLISIQPYCHTQENWRSFYYSVEIFKWVLVPEVTFNQQTPFLT